MENVRDVQRESRYLSLHQLLSGFCARERLRILRLLLCCGVMLAFSEDEANVALEEVAILTEQNAHSLGPHNPGQLQAFDSNL